MALFLFGLSSEVFSVSRADHLVPVRGEFWAEYRKIWQPKLLVSPIDLAGFVLLPNGGSVETAVSIYQQSGKDGALAGDCWVTRTQASELLADFMSVRRDKRHGDLQNVQIKRWDAPLPRSTALLIHELWLTMLLRTAPEPNPEITLVDSSSEIYFARNSKGVLLEAESPNHLGQTTTEMGKVGLLLLDYPISNERQRSRLAKEIEKNAKRLLERVTRNKLR